MITLFCNMDKKYEEYSDLQTLLDLNGFQYHFQDGYWVKIEAVEIIPSEHIPHGISYSLTLHDRNNTRVLGFDNAHAVKPARKKKYGPRIITWDHKHKYQNVCPYEFESASQIIEDFWKEVKIIRGN